MENTLNLSYSGTKQNAIKGIDDIKLRRVKQSSIHYDFRNIEEDIRTILISANNDKNILEECENDLQEEYNIFLAIRQSRINFVSGMNFFFIIAILGVFYSGSQLLEILGIYRRLTIQELLQFSPFITFVVGAVMLTVKFGVENKFINSISAHEYCIKLLKNAKIRADSCSLDNDN